MAKQNVDTISAQTQAPQNTEAPAASVSNQQTSKIFRLSNDKRQGKVFITLEGDVIDPNTGKQRRMRVLRGVQTPWFDEQPPTVYPPSFVSKNEAFLEFDRGNCIVPLSDPMKLIGAQLTFANVATAKKYPQLAKPQKFYFYEWNPQEQNAKAIDEENNVIQAMQLAMNATMEDMLPHAQYLNIQLSDEMGVEFDEKALKAAYIRKAKNEPLKFLNSINSPTVKLNHLVRKAIDGAKIDLGKQPGTAYWTDGGFISALPTGRDAVDFLVEFAALPGEANALFQNRLKELDKT